MSSAKQTIEKLLSSVDVRINGTRDWDIQVHDERVYKRVLRHRELGLGESYMDGWWSAKELDQLIAKLLSANLQQELSVSAELIWSYFVGKATNRQNLKRAGKNAAHHYNIGNDLFERMLDKRMVYSCGYWQDAKTLDAAQEAKLDLICRKLHLKKGMTVLDIGCGWGGFAGYAAEKYGVEVTGISPAAEQVKMARLRTQGLEVKILQKDYRSVAGTYDRVVSIGMLEHVGAKNYKTFFDRTRQLLKPGGFMLHHVIGSNHTSRAADPWTDKYIFPGGHIPSLKELTKATENKLIIEDLHNFGPYYDTTLMAWYANFVKHYSEIKDEYDDRFYRMWTYYLLMCAAAFRVRQLQLWQIVLRPIEKSEVYKAVR